MSSKQSSPEIRGAAFSAAREKCAISIEELAHLACLSKKQIQQIENGQGNSFYSPTIKLVAARKVAKLIQLDERDAFDFGPQAELPFTQASDAIQSELTNAEQESSLDLKKEVLKQEASQANEGEPKEANKKAVSQMEVKPSMRMHSGTLEQKPAGKKWLWLLPVGALVLALLQFRPLLEDQLDAIMGKAKPVEVVALTAVPADATPANPPAESPAGATPAEPPASATAAATPQAAPVITPNPAVAVAANPACPLPDASIENYKSPSPTKPGNMVYVKTLTAQIVCVEDGDGKVQSKTLEPGLGHSFYGKPPFKLLTSGLSSAEVFFQGFRVRPSNADSKSILLVQVD